VYYGSAAIDAVPSDVRFRSKLGVGDTHTFVRSMNSRRLMGFPEQHDASSIAGQGCAESDAMSELGFARAMIIQMPALHSVARLIGLCELWGLISKLPRP
jgi:hypothetical protein